ncbi:MAG: hypothetical protein DRQ47_07995 [Gammaproteobacteria bacterium]|nr:MAG: hypothetical protein DRQ47_07995 [Gammaproteobacteria bacterium]
MSEEEKTNKKRVREESEEGKRCCCELCANNPAFLEHLKNITEANARIVNQLAKEVFDNKNAMMSLLNKLMTTVAEVQESNTRINRRTEQLGKVVKKIKTTSRQELDLLPLTKQIATLQDLTMKNFAQLK